MRTRSAVLVADEAGQHRRAEPRGGHRRHRQHRVDRADLPPRADLLVGPALGARRRRAESDPRRGRDHPPAVFVRHRRRAIDRPADRADAAADQRLGRIVGAADRDVGVAARKVERLLGDDEVDLDAGIGGAEAGENRRQQADRDRIDRRHPQFAARLGVAAGDAPLELQDRFGHRAGERDHLLARLGRLIAGARAFEQPRPDVVLDRRQATEHRGMIEIQRLGGADQRARVGDRLDQTEFIPVECGGHGWNSAFVGSRKPRIVCAGASRTVQENECRSRRDMRSRRQASPARGAAARRSRSLMATPSPRSGIGAAAMRAAPLSSSARR